MPSIRIRRPMTSSIPGTIQGAVSLAAVSTLTHGGLAGCASGRGDAEQRWHAARHRRDHARRCRAATSPCIRCPPPPARPATYDLVIHGPNIQTVIIKSVPVTAGAPGSAHGSAGNADADRGDSLPGQFQHQLAGRAEQFTGGLLPDAAAVRGSALSGGNARPRSDQRPLRHGPGDLRRQPAVRHLCLRQAPSP